MREAVLPFVVLIVTNVPLPMLTVPRRSDR